MKDWESYALACERIRRMHTEAKSSPYLPWTDEEREALQRRQLTGHDPGDEDRKR